MEESQRQKSAWGSVLIPVSNPAQVPLKAAMPALPIQQVRRELSTHHQTWPYYL
jgi:hypothetical protein